MSHEYAGSLLSLPLPLPLSQAEYSIVISRSQNRSDDVRSFVRLL